MNKSNRDTIKVVLCLVIFMLMITSIFFMVKTSEYMYHNDDAIINEILNKKWYSSANSYAYEMINFKADKTISYIFYDKESDEIGKYNECYMFIYSRNENEIKLKCNDSVKNVEIKSHNDERLTLSIDNEIYVFYSSYEEASK